MSYKVEAWPWCADYCKKNKHSPYDSYFWDKAMLEYRREHNIFEAGDIAVNRRGEESRLLKIWRVDICLADKRMSIADYDADGLAGWSRFHCLRHATPEEIAAGHRL